MLIRPLLCSRDKPVSIKMNTVVFLTNKHTNNIVIVQTTHTIRRNTASFRAGQMRAVQLQPVPGRHYQTQSRCQPGPGCRSEPVPAGPRVPVRAGASRAPGAGQSRGQPGPGCRCQPGPGCGSEPVPAGPGCWSEPVPAGPRVPVRAGASRGR